MKLTKQQCLTPTHGFFDKAYSNLTDAWNYFPHKVLGGISPAEKLLEHHNKIKK